MEKVVELLNGIVVLWCFGIGEYPLKCVIDFFIPQREGMEGARRATGSPSLCEVVIGIPIDRSALQIYLIILIEWPSNGKLFYSMIFADS